MLAAQQASQPLAEACHPWEINLEVKYGLPY